VDAKGAGDMSSILHEALWSHLGANSGLFMGRCPPENPVPQPNKKATRNVRWPFAFCVGG
jgi:hypothetical protein